MHPSDETPPSTVPAAEQEGVAASKTRRKAEMHALQELGEGLVALSAARLTSLGLPEPLADAIAAAQHIHKHEARRRQMQFIGRLMREIDPEPIRASIAQWAAGPRAAKAQMHEIERWRERLLGEPDALERLCEAKSGADRPRLAALVQRVHAERAHGGPPHAYRELFRVLSALLGEGHHAG